MFAVDAVFHDLCCFCQLYAAVYTEEFIGIFCHNSFHLFTSVQDQFQTVCQIVFTLRIVVIQFTQRVLQVFAVEDIDACVDFIDESFHIGSIFMLYDAHKGTCVITHDSAVACGVCHFGRNHSHAVAFFSVYFYQLRQCFPCDEGCITVQDHHIAVFINEVAGHHNCVACALLFCLQGKRNTFGFDAFLYHFRFVAYHNANFFCAAALCSFDHIVHHALIQNFMEHLRFLGFHTGAFAGCQNDRFQIFHVFSSSAENGVNVF